MNWAKLVNGNLEYAPPEIYDENGIVREFKTYDDYINAGYKRVIRKKPAYNPYLQYLVLKEIVDDEDIYILYDVMNINNEEENSLTYEHLQTIIDEEVRNNG